jgi:hypothetical protein
LLDDKDPDPYLGLTDPDPDPGGPKTYGSDGSGSATLVEEQFHIIFIFVLYVFYCSASEA